MQCRIGITTNPKKKKQFWQSIYPEIEGWEILGIHQSKEDAIDFQNKYHDEDGCIIEKYSNDIADSFWFVYHFKYIALE